MFTRKDEVNDLPVVVEDAKKGKGAMKKGKPITSPTNMAVVPPKETSVPASKNAAKKAKIKPQKLR